MKLKLPPFKVTQRSTSGKVSHHILPRLCGLEGKANVYVSGDGLALDGNCQLLQRCVNVTPMCLLAEGQVKIQGRVFLLPHSMSLIKKIQQNRGGRQDQLC